jgi:lantibiotic modifying enzyme
MMTMMRQTICHGDDADMQLFRAIAEKLSDAELLEVTLILRRAKNFAAAWLFMEEAERRRSLN